MGLFEDESLEDSFVSNEESNKYLKDNDAGLSLIKKILSSSSNVEQNYIIDFLSNEILPLIADLRLEDELKLYRELLVIGSKAEEYKRIEMLKGKKVLGVGGKFSAGKSCFINSITNAELPEGQRPTTSIATYIVNAERKKNVALTKQSTYVKLDDEALDALTHKFFEKYQIGFSKLIQQLVIYTPGFTYPNIAILDTPGYSKSDINKGEDSTDAEMARKQLQSVDYLIWLVDSVQGVVTQRDLEFISTLKVSTPILFVFTKASLETNENIIKKIEQAKKMLKKCNKEIYDVIAYDSVTKESIVGAGVLEKFLNEVNEKNADNDNLEKVISSIGTNIQNQIENQIKDIHIQIDQIDNLITKINGVEHMNSLLDFQLEKYVKLNKLSENSALLDMCLKKFIQII